MSWSMPPAGPWNTGMPPMGIDMSGMGMASYTPEQWTAMQQNWQQWTQWQQQYAQWQQQYGEKYAQQMQSMQSIPPMGMMAGVPPPPIQAAPPAPPPPEKPPPPPHENDQPLFGSTQNQQTAAPVTPVQPPIPYSDNVNTTSSSTGNNQNWSQNAKTNQASSTSGNTEALDKLAEEERLFDIQFKNWEDEIEKWRKDNVNHPDKKAYKEYEDKFEACKVQLLQRRQQMKERRARLLGHPPPPVNTGPTSTSGPIDPPKSVNDPYRNNRDNRSQNYSNQSNQHQQQRNSRFDRDNNRSINPQDRFARGDIENYDHKDGYDRGNNQNYDPQNCLERGHNKSHQDRFSRGNNRNVDPTARFDRGNKKNVDSEDSYNSYNDDLNNDSQMSEPPINSNFLPSSNVGKGIPGLDLVLETEKTATEPKEKGPSEVIDITDDGQTNASQIKAPDYSTISQGIDSILGDEKIMNMLSLVQQNMPKPGAAQDSNNLNISQGNYQNIPPLGNFLNVPPPINRPDMPPQVNDNRQKMPGPPSNQNSNFYNNQQHENRQNNMPYNNRQGPKYPQQQKDPNYHDNYSGKQGQFSDYQNPPPNVYENDQNDSYNNQQDQYNNQYNNQTQGRPNNIPPRGNNVPPRGNNMPPGRPNMGGPMNNIPPRGPNTRGPMTNMPPRGPNPGGPITNMPPRGPITNMPPRGPITNMPSRGPITNMPPRGPNMSGQAPSLLDLKFSNYPHLNNDMDIPPTNRPPPPPIEPSKPKWVHEPLFSPSIIVEYEHKALRLKARDFIEPVHTFDYSHKSKDSEYKKHDFEREADDLFIKYPRREMDRYERDFENRPPRDDFMRDDFRPRVPRDEFENRRKIDDLYDRRIDSQRGLDSFHRDNEREWDRVDRSRFDSDPDRDRLRDRDLERERERLREREIEIERENERLKEKDIEFRDLTRDRHGNRREIGFKSGRDEFRTTRDDRRDKRDDRRRSRSRDRDSRKRGRSRESEISDTSSKSKKPNPDAKMFPDAPKHIVMIDDLLEMPGREMRPEKIVIILRGPPGSGKSYLAKLIRDREAEYGGTVRIMSIDDYFMQEGEIEDKDPVTGKMVKKASLKYEYDEKQEEVYLTSLKRAFKRSITDGFFTFLIFDAINDQLRSYADIWNFARQSNFQVYVCTMDLDSQTCFKRNIHNRTKDDIDVICSRFFPTPAHHIQLDATTLLQSAAIEDVHMEDVSDEVEMEDVQEEVETSFTSKWERMDDVNQLARLDGTNKPLRSSQLSMEDYLQLDEWQPNTAKPGKKTVRWADIEERREQEKMRAIGFVVGKTDWNRMTDPTMGSSALTKTKYIERVRRN